MRYVTQDDFADFQKDQKGFMEVMKEFNGIVKEQKAVASGHTGTLLHGPGGLFNTPGLDEALVSMHVQARGLGQLLPAFASRSTHPWYGFLTGISDDVGSEPDYPCDDAPSGYIKSGVLTAKFGHVARGSQTIRIPDTLWQINSGETMDLNLIGSILNPNARGQAYPSDLTEDGLLDMVTKAEMVTIGVRFERQLARMLWNGLGTGANDTVGGGYVEFPGVDAQVITGQVDGETNAAMASADSLVLTHNYGNVYTTDIVGPLQEAEYYLNNLATETGVDPVTWVIVMRPMAWQAISEVWPIQYNTQIPLGALAANSENRILHDAGQLINSRDSMRAGLTLTLNGRTYPVVLDNAITEQNNQSGVGLGLDEFASSIYFLPLSINSNFPVLYWEYLDQKLGVPQTNLLNGMETWYTDAGRFLWSYKTDYTCFKIRAETSPRVVLRTPHLAAKVQKVMYTRTIPLRDMDPTSEYWVDGGVSAPLRSQSGPTRYAGWL